MEELYEVTLQGEFAVWFAKEPGETPDDIRRKRALWESAHQIALSDEGEDRAQAIRELEAAGYNLDGYDATFWVPPAEGPGRQLLRLWVLFRRGESEPAIAYCPKAQAVTQEEWDEQWMRELFLDGNARAIAEAPTYVQSLKGKLTHTGPDSSRED